jgi:hypothetical protein
VTSDADSLPDDVETLKALSVAERSARRLAAEVDARIRTLEIERLKLTIARLRHERFGASAERGAKLLDRLELQLADLEETVARRKKRLPRSPAPPGARRRPASGAGRPAYPCRRSWRASAWCTRRHRPAPAAGAPCASSARM